MSGKKSSIERSFLSLHQRPRFYLRSTPSIPSSPVGQSPILPGAAGAKMRALAEHLFPTEVIMGLLREQKDDDKEDEAIAALVTLEQGGPPPAGTPPRHEPNAAGAHGSAGKRTPRGRLHEDGGSYATMNNAGGKGLPGSIPSMPGFSLGGERSNAGGASGSQEKRDEGGGDSQQRDESAALPGGGSSVRLRGALPGSGGGSRSGTHAKAGGDGSAQNGENTGEGSGKGKGKAKGKGKQRGASTASGSVATPATPPPTGKRQRHGKAKRTGASVEDEDAEEEDPTSKPKKSKKTAKQRGEKASEDHRPSGAKPKGKKKMKSPKARQQEEEGSADTSKAKSKSKSKGKKKARQQEEAEDPDDNDPGKDYAFHKSVSKNLWKETIFKPAAEELKNHAAYVAKVGTAHIDELFLSAFGMRKGVGWFRSQRKQASQYVKDHGQSGSKGGKTEKLKVIMRQELYSNHPAVTKAGMRESFGGLETDSDDEDDDDSESEGGEGGEVEDAPLNQELWGDLSRHTEDRGDSAANLTAMEEGDDCSALEDEAEDDPPADFGDAGGDCGQDGDSPPEGDGSNDQGGAAGGVLPPPAARVPADQPIRRRPVGSGGGISTDGTPLPRGSGGGGSSRGAPSRSTARPRHVPRGTHGALDEEMEMGTSGLPPGPAAKGRRKSSWNPPGVSVEEYMANTGHLGQQKLALMQQLVAAQGGEGGR
ncbi:expressed unknown protein [Ectocarpus siliculosus]|uniref:Uncharacterized protein n=1 Tax=Ectocarpus siliculosus TaxID=2880 RepID=D7G1B9_ECTSI|nr:expressed unknown protein [Ectocarpus siliculosus]|eukprot:CBJ33229.1 expressed unknown protein [Ectocarpus siliculosus]